MDQYTCITEKRYAVLTPNSSIPSTASSAPIKFQGRCSVSPDAPRVLIESNEKNKASMGESRAPSHKYADYTNQDRDMVPHLRSRVSNRIRILIPTKASITTAVAWIAIVNTMSDKPQSQPGWSNISIARAPQKRPVRTKRHRIRIVTNRPFG
jgi:hypothetical protein